MPDRIKGSGVTPNPQQTPPENADTVAEDEKYSEESPQGTVQGDVTIAGGTFAVDAAESPYHTVGEIQNAMSATHEHGRLGDLKNAYGGPTGIRQPDSVADPWRFHRLVTSMTDRVRALIKKRGPSGDINEILRNRSGAIEAAIRKVVDAEPGRLDIYLTKSKNKKSTSCDKLAVTLYESCFQEISGNPRNAHGGPTEPVGSPYRTVRERQDTTTTTQQQERSGGPRNAHGGPTGPTENPQPDSIADPRRFHRLVTSMTDRVRDMAHALPPERRPLGGIEKLIDERSGDIEAIIRAAVAMQALRCYEDHERLARNICDICFPEISGDPRNAHGGPTEPTENPQPDSIAGPERFHHPVHTVTDRVRQLVQALLAERMSLGRIEKLIDERSGDIEAIIGAAVDMQALKTPNDHERLAWNICDICFPEISGDPSNVHGGPTEPVGSLHRTVRERQDTTTTTQQQEISGDPRNAHGGPTEPD